MTTPRYDASRTSTRDYEWANGQKMAIGATSSQSAPIDSIEIMLIADVRCFVQLGEDPTAADAAGSMPLEPGERFHLKLTQGWKLAVISDGAPGTLFILPVS